MSASGTPVFPGEYQSEEQVIFTLFKMLEEVQKENAIYLRGSLAYYGIFGFYGRCCNDIDLAAYDPLAAAQILGLCVDAVREDNIEGHIVYILQGIRRNLSVEILRYPRNTDTVEVVFPFIQNYTRLQIKSDLSIKSCFRITCVSLEHIITEKLFSMAYALRENPINEYSIYKNLFDLTHPFCHEIVNDFFSSQEKLHQHIETYLYIERSRKNRFLSAEQMLAALRRITDTSLFPASFNFEYTPLSTNEVLLLFGSIL